jgi:predicted secreted Zn-dependent protease
MNPIRSRPARDSIVLGLMLLGLTTPAAVAQHSLVIQTNYYVITGASVREMRQSLNKQRPGGISAGTDALTTWTIQWQMKATPTDNGCQLTQFTTRATITLTLPIWRMPTNAPAGVRSAWARYLQALTQHELGHAKFGREAAEVIQRQVGTIHSDTDCDRLRQRVKDMVETVIRDHRKREADYDRETDHGRKDGARFP